VVTIALRATGFARALAIVIVSAGVTAAFPDGRVDALGPLSFQPEIPVVLFVPMMLSVAVGIAHDEWPTPIVPVCVRVLVARAWSYFLTLLSCAFAVSIPVLMGTATYVSGMARNTMFLSGAVLIVREVGGSVFGWIASVIAYSMAILSPPSENPLSVYGFLLRPNATPTQLVIATLVFALGLTIAVVAPRHRGYLPKGALEI